MEKVFRTRILVLILMSLVLGSWFLVVLQSEAASLSGTVTIAGKPAEGSVVYLESTEETPPPPVAAPVVIEQRDLAFSPPVLPVVRGTVVKFTNSDSTLHNVFSPSAIEGKFNLGTYGHGEERSMTFSTPGEVIILCNIHMEMEARILVLKDPYFATTAPDGRYHIPDVPPGAYLLRVWKNHLFSFSEPLEMSATGDLVLDLQIKR